MRATSVPRAQGPRRVSRRSRADLDESVGCGVPTSDVRRTPGASSQRRWNHPLAFGRSQARRVPAEKCSWIVLTRGGQIGDEQDVPPILTAKPQPERKSKVRPIAVATLDGTSPEGLPAGRPTVDAERARSRRRTARTNISAERQATARAVVVDDGARKSSGAYYTGNVVVQSLVRWAVVEKTDRMLDPSCGDGRFLVAHPNSVGVEQDPAAAAVVHERVPGSLIHQGDFFAWASDTLERFDCAAGNPPFIRYQRFAGEVRNAALRLCAKHGADFSSLTSSWAPFIVATASLLRTGGRMAFVVPAEIGHAPYALPLLRYLAQNFAHVQLVAVRKKLFPDLSEDCWLLYADGFGRAATHFLLSPVDEFEFMSAPPTSGVRISIEEWRRWNGRLRPFLLPDGARMLYRSVADAPGVRRLGDIAKVGIGYVTGDNDFFHLRPSEAARLGVSPKFLHPAVRNGKALTGRAVTEQTVADWKERDEPVLLLRLNAQNEVPRAVQQYLDTSRGRAARVTYKCRNRTPWYVVPDVTVPDAFLSYMSSDGPILVANEAGCVGTNSVHVVKLTGRMKAERLQALWRQRFTKLSCELEGHPLGGGIFKVEPREAQRVVLPERRTFSQSEELLIENGIQVMQRWRHFGT